MSSKDLSKGSLVSVWLLNNMETIIQNQGLQHIVEKSLMYLDKKSINSFRLVNNDFKRITESPRVLRVLKKRKLASVIKEFLLLKFTLHMQSHQAKKHMQSLQAKPWIDFISLELGFKKMAFKLISFQPGVRRITALEWYRWRELT